MNSLEQAMFDFMQSFNSQPDLPALEVSFWRVIVLATILEDKECLVGVAMLMRQKHPDFYKEKLRGWGEDYFFHHGMETILSYEDTPLPVIKNIFEEFKMAGSYNALSHWFNYLKEVRPAIAEKLVL